ncbi:MAG: exo-alpha-sialidase [Clostridia bacterium]|nr:exo-alpha-sialidase [Clostridia bacterium]
MVIEKANAEYSTCRIPVLVMTHSGDLLACYECRKDYSDWADIDLKIIKSSDGGETWQTLHLIKGGGNTLNNPVFIVKGNVVHFLYCKNYKLLFYCQSQDGGETFSTPREITEVFENKGFDYTVVAVGPSHGIVHNGNLLVPVWFADNKENLEEHRPSFIATIYSEDEGKTWKLGERIGEGFFVNPSECSLAVDKNNKVLISVRNENGDHFHNFRGFAESATGYAEWKNIVLRENMRDWICQGAMYAEKKKLYHVNCVGEARTQLTLKFSSDGFLSYESVLIDEIGGYSDLVVKGDVAYVLYERNPREDGLYFKKIQL